MDEKSNSMAMSTQDSPRKPNEEMGEIVAEVDWSRKEERWVVAKLNVFVVFPLFLAFFFLCLDRSNISSALTDHFTKDLHITTNEASLGNQLQLAGIIILEIPSNMILQMVGPQKVLIFQIFAWGLVATFQAFIKTKASYFATRFLLGAFEGGFIPGSMYMMATFFKRSEVSTRFAFYYFGNYFASGTSSLIAAGILNMDGVRGWSGWRWLFLIDGAMTLGFAFVMLALLPGSPIDTRPIHRLFNIFSERESRIIRTRILIEDPEREREKPHPSLKEWLQVFGNGRLWMHLIINLIGLTPAGGLALFAPTIVKNLGFDKIHANALVSVGYYIGIVLALLLAIFARKTKKFGIASILPFAWSCIFAGVLYHFDIQHKVDKWALYAVFILVLAAMLIVQPINNAWCGINARNPQERSVGLAMCVIGSNLGGLIGQQLFRSSDAPKYRHGFIAVFAFYAVSVVIVCLQILQYWWSNKRLDAREVQGENDVEDEQAEMSRWRYTL